MFSGKVFRASSLCNFPETLHLWTEGLKVKLSDPKAGSKPCQNNPPTARQSHRIRPVLSSGSTPHMHLPACLEYSEG